jgi:NADH:ubiquinone oxidoreductase subunit K
VGALGLNHYLLLSAVVFGIGLIGVLVRRNAIIVLMCLELMFNAANINLVAVSRFRPDLAGQILTIFTITVAAAEVAIGLAIVISVFRNAMTVNVDELHEMKG